MYCKYSVLCVRGHLKSTISILGACKPPNCLPPCMRYGVYSCLFVLQHKMGIAGLMKYIRDHPNRNRIAPRADLVELARDRCPKDPTGANKAILVCDYAAVVHQLECALLEKRQPKFCGYYGCDTRLLGQQFKLFVEVLRSINVEPVFIGDGPADADEESYKARFENRKQRQITKWKRSVEWETAVIKSAKIPEFSLPHSLCYTVCDCVLHELKVECTMSSCEKDAALIDYYKTRPNALGILSTDTNFAIADGCRFLPLDPEFFDFSNVMGFHDGDIRQGVIESFPCRYTSCDILAECLGLKSADMPWFAMLRGNNYTLPYLSKVRRILGIPTTKVESIAQWINEGNPQEEVIGEEEFNKACHFSKKLYSGNLQFASPRGIGTGCARLSSAFLPFEKGIYWRQPVAEAQSLNLPLPYDVSQPIRNIAYALFGLPEVTEYDHRSYESRGSIQVHGLTNLTNVRTALQCCGVTVRAAALHHLISTPLDSLDQLLAESQQGAPAPEDLPPDTDEQEMLRGIIAVSTLAYLQPMRELIPDEKTLLACLLAFAATTAGVRGDVDIGHADPNSILRAVSLSSTITVTLLSLYYIAELLDLSPKASDILCSSVFVPAYTAVMCHLPAGIAALAPVVGVIDSPHTTELMGCIQTMGRCHDKPELTPPIALATAVRSYTALVGEVRALTLQHQ